MKAIDLFSGAGGFSLAALDLGIEILAAIELDKDACDTYSKNLIHKRENSIKLLNKDIMTISPDELMNSLQLKEKELDLIIGGPPCQGFSSHRIKNAGVNDPRNELLIRYYDFVKIFQPKMFLVENVPGLLWEKHKDYLNNFKRLAANSGYNILGPLKLNAKDYGVPQNRNRVFILGLRDDISISEGDWPPSPTHFKDKKPYWVNASEIFEKPIPSIIEKITAVLGQDVAQKLKFKNTLKENKSDPNNIHMNHADYMIERFSLTPINGSREDVDFRLPCHSNGYVGHKDVYGRIRLSLPGPTITTGCFNPSKGRFLHPWDNHGITVRQAARFQTFPDDYIFSGGIISQGKQVGNAVPVNLGKILLKSCVEIIISNSQRDDKNADEIS
ncbi:DNA cytosine methyltransferase [Cronobacter sakazakii]|uniref:DNA cytosine methyltransferase n=1 Tax=Cronobacter sakazakii TaxID=28141 RepID=UPI0015E3D14B|nr:DNA cytosine methyltransferase [Cronobacter sakazakii]ELY2764506.1 DNA cytosine methyltransferase [Cronobacter sakazakii]ELY3990289.1 DNA cytosine methyltransferase [Cronobacter sakazakii]